MPLHDTLDNWQHIDTVHWTGLNAEVAPCAFRHDNSMHELGCTQYCIYWAGLYAFGTTDTFVFSDVGNSFYLFLFTVFFV